MARRMIERRGGTINLSFQVEKIWFFLFCSLTRSFLYFSLGESLTLFHHVNKVPTQFPPALSRMSLIVEASSINGSSVTPRSLRKEICTFESITSDEWGIEPGQATLHSADPKSCTNEENVEQWTESNNLLPVFAGRNQIRLFTGSHFAVAESSNQTTIKTVHPLSCFCFDVVVVVVVQDLVKKLKEKEKNKLFNPSEIIWLRWALVCWTMNRRTKSKAPAIREQRRW